MATSLSPEFQLVAACAIWPPSDRRIQAIRAAAAAPLDWPRFVRVAKRHQVVGLVHDGLTRVRPTVPPQIVGEIGALAAALVRENLALAAEAVRLQRLFDDANLPVLFVKGPSLAAVAFGNLGLRSGKDIDLLVPHETLWAARALVTHAGYYRFDPPPDISEAKLHLLMALRKDFGFIHQATGLRIELHWRLFLNPHAMDAASLMGSSRLVPLTATMELRTLGEEDLFVYLCVHGALHWWKQLKWLADINALLATAPEAGVERLIRAAEARGAGRAAAQAILLCQRIFGTHLSARLMATISKGPTIRWLEATAMSAMSASESERVPQEARFGTTRGSLSTFLLSRSWRYRLVELKNQLISQADVLSVSLPEKLSFLYPVLRLPLWAWRHWRPSRHTTDQ